MSGLILVPLNLNKKANIQHASNATISTALIAFRTDDHNNVFVPVRNVSGYKSVASDGTHQVFVDSQNNVYVQESFDSAPTQANISGAHAATYSDGNFFLMLANQKEIC